MINAVCEGIEGEVIRLHTGDILYYCTIHMDLQFLIDRRRVVHGRMAAGRSN
jgi:hypothetical protein